MYAARTRLVALAAAAAVAATSVRADRCCEQAKAMGVYDVEDTTECCRLVAPAGPTKLTEQLNCTMLPVYSCFDNPDGKIGTAKDVGQDPGACCAACIKKEGCVSWTHGNGGGGSCNLYKNIGPVHSNDKNGCSAGTIGGHGRPIPPGPFPPPPPGPRPSPGPGPGPAPGPITPRGDKPNILFLVVESTDGASAHPLSPEPRLQ